MSSNLFPFSDFLRLGNNQIHNKPCLGGKVVAEPQESHDFLLKKKVPETQWALSAVHFRDAEPTSEVSIFLWPLATNGESQSLQNLNIVMLIHCLILRDVISVNKSFHVKNNLHDFHFGTQLTHILRFWRLGRLPQQDLRFLSGSHP